MIQRSRFYRDVTVEGAPGGYAVFLDGKPAGTPAGEALILPTEALAQAVAEEWRAQGEKIRTETMIFTRLANTAIDRIALNPQAVVEQILSFAKSDLLCYRAESPRDLVNRQAAVWDPLLQWVQREYGAAFCTASGIGFVEQPADAVEALERALAVRGAFALAGLQAAAALLGSTLIALAISDGRIDANDAFAAAQLDEIYQAEKWGQDEEALRRSRKKSNELSEIAEFFRLLDHPTSG